MGTSLSKNEVFREIEQVFGQVPHWARQIPEPGLGGFWTLMRDFYLGETKIPNKYKELIGLGVSGATRCKYCALFHTEAARLFGATDDEISEACLMGGMTMLASTYLNAAMVDYDEFRKETLDALAFVKKSQAQPRKGAPVAHA